MPVVISAVLGVVVFVWGVTWPRFVPTPEGGRFDAMVVLGGPQNVGDAADPEHAYLKDEGLAEYAS